MRLRSSMSRPRPTETDSDIWSPSIVPMTDEPGDDVSMTKITDRPDQAAVAAQMLDLDQRGVVDLEPLPPLHDHGALAGQLFEPQVTELAAVLHPVQIDVGKLQATRIDAHELKCWAGDRRMRAGASSHTADESRLAGAQLAGEQNHVARDQSLAKALSGFLGLRRGARLLVKQSGRSRSSSAGRPHRPRPRP